jgi:hypothetical protein
MFDSHKAAMDEKTSKFYAKVRKYGGWQAVPADRLHAIFVEVVKPTEMGFVFAKRGYWARRIDGDISHVIKLDALKGGAYGLSYGLSLSYVPYPYVPTLRWHRTLRSVRLDLHEQPQVHLADPADPAPDTEFCVADTGLGERCFREELERGWTRCSPRICAWFDAARSFAGIVERCTANLAVKHTWIGYVPGARLVRAFTYAKMGQLNEAKADLEVYLEKHQEGAEARANLYAALDKIASKSP